jgi:hypothetical protein
MDKEANISEVRYLYGNPSCICDRHKREGESALPGETLQTPRKVSSSRGDEKRCKESAESIVAAFIKEQKHML